MNLRINMQVSRTVLELTPECLVCPQRLMGGVVIGWELRSHQEKRSLNIIGFASRVVRHWHYGFAPCCEDVALPFRNRSFFVSGCAPWFRLCLNDIQGLKGVAQTRRHQAYGRAKPHPHNRRQSRRPVSARLLRQSRYYPVTSHIESSQSKRQAEACRTLVSQVYCYRYNGLRNQESHFPPG
jgi:hypothetical protein